MNTKNLALFLVMSVLWGSSWSITKRGLEFVPPLNFSSQQFLLSAIALMPFLFAAKGRIFGDHGILGRVVVFGLLNALSIAMVNIGLVQESSGIGAVLVFTQPLIVFGLSVLFLHERAKTMKLLGVMIGFAGTVITVLGGETGSVPTFSLNAILLVLGAFVWALAVVYYKKFLSDVDVIAATALQFAVGFILLFVFSLSSEGFVFPLSSEYVEILIFVSLGASIVGTVIWLFLLSKEDATKLSTYSFIVPIIALFIGWGLLGENIDQTSYLGTALIITAIYLVQKQ